MDPALVPAAAPIPTTFEDGLGERHAVLDRGRNEIVDMLCLRSELTAVPSFEFSLRERVSSLAAFRHSCYGRVRSVERLKDPASTLALVSDATVGVRLSDLLAFAERSRIPFDIDAALCLLRQLVPAIVMLHEHAPDAAHGALAPERLLVTSSARLMLVEYAMGSALEQLHYSQNRYWKELRIALPRSAGLAKFDQRSDVTQLGVTALSLILGRQLTDDESPARLGDVVASAWAVSSRGGLEPLPAGLRTWLTNALQFDSRHAFRSAVDAQAELERVLGEGDYLAAPATLETFLSIYLASLEPIESAPAPPAPQPAMMPVVNPVDHSGEIGHVSVVSPAGDVAAPRPPALTSWPPAPIAAPPPAARKEIAVKVRKPGKRWPLAAAGVVLVALAGAGVAAARRYVTPVTAPNDGTLVVSTNPAGAHLIVDGVDKGETPVTVKLSPGTHGLELRGDGPPRLMPITIAAGAQLSQYIELPKVAATLGQLQIRTEPAGARVSVDGVPRGMSPLTVAQLFPGEHVVQVESDLGTMKQTVTIDAGVTASLVLPLGAPEGANVSGWIALTAPADVQVFENKRLLGSSQSDRLMVSAGRHEIEIVNDTLGYRSTRTVQVSPGKVTPIRLEFPKGTIALNAIPWADVWVDGEKAGETPIGDLQLAIGPHDFVFRHPELGEQHHTAIVTLKAPARLSVDLRKK
jgi:PEGA domain